MDCMDLYQLHRIDPKAPMEESLGALKEMQKQGKIRYIGLSEVSVNEIERAKKIVDIVSVQNEYNISNRQSICQTRLGRFLDCGDLSTPEVETYLKQIA